MSREYPCVHHKNGWCYFDPEQPDACVFGPCDNETPSNADCIRAMDDDELAEFISNPCQCTVDTLIDGYRECGNKLCLEYLKNWLQQPAKEV